MWLTYIRARVANPTRPGRAATLRFLVDSGAVYSVVPDAPLRRRGIRPHSSRTFILDPMKRVLRPLPMLLSQLRTRHE